MLGGEEMIQLDNLKEKIMYTHKIKQTQRYTKYYIRRNYFEIK